MCHQLSVSSSGFYDKVERAANAHKCENSELLEVIKRTQTRRMNLEQNNCIQKVQAKVHLAASQVLEAYK